MRLGLVIVSIICASVWNSVPVDGRNVQDQIDHRMEERIEYHFQQRRFPKAGRTLPQKIQEAKQFLEEEIPKSEIIGVGAAIVYKDQVVLSKGYGLRVSNDSSSTVSETALFQIGSVSKTMVTLGIGLLVDEGKMQWRDSVKKHLPWLTLVDKYAEEHLNIGDLLSMNSGFGELPDLADFMGEYSTEKALIEALQYLEPQFSLREQAQYANINFVMLGQIIQSVSGLPWEQFLEERLWKPLGMKHTFASAELIPSGEELNAGHFACGGEVLGPYDLLTSNITFLSPGREHGLNSAGSIVSSAVDMAKFMRLILNKGTVDGVTLFKSPSTIAEMITGKVPTDDNMVEKMDLFNLGFHTHH